MGKCQVDSQTGGKSGGKLPYCRCQYVLEHGFSMASASVVSEIPLKLTGITLLRIGPGVSNAKDKQVWKCDQVKQLALALPSTNFNGIHTHIVRMRNCQCHFGQTHCCSVTSERGLDSRQTRHPIYQGPLRNIPARRTPSFITVGSLSLSPKSESPRQLHVLLSCCSDHSHSLGADPSSLLFLLSAIRDFTTAYTTPNILFPSPTTFRPTPRLPPSSPCG